MTVDLAKKIIYRDTIQFRYHSLQLAKLWEIRKLRKNFNGNIFMRILLRIIIPKRCLLGEKSYISLYEGI